MAPSSRYTGASTTSPVAGAPWPRARLRVPEPAGPGENPGPRAGGRTSRGTMTGSVPRWAANQSVPATHSKAAMPTPAAGKTSVASSVTAAGPIMKHSSSATDSKLKAACSRGEPASRPLHRARTMVPSDGMVAPAIAPGTKNVQVGSCNCTAVISAAVATVNTASIGSSTRRWPYESARRASRGEQNAKPREPAAETVPATPYLPVAAAMSKTVPSPNIAIGIRPMTPAAEKRQAPGIRKISAYGRSGRVSRRRKRGAGERLTVRCASSTPVIGRIAPWSSPYRTMPISFPAADRPRRPSRPVPTLLRLPADAAARRPWLDGRHARLRRVPACLVRRP